MFELKNYGEFLQYKKNSAYEMTKKGKCTGCGACCSNMLPLTKSEIIEIKRYIKVHNIKPQNHVFVGFSDLKALDMACLFLNINKPDKKCTIYEARPGICRDFVCNKTKEDIAHEVLTNTSLLAEEDYYLTPMREEFFGR